MRPNEALLLESKKKLESSTEVNKALLEEETQRKDKRNKVSFSSNGFDISHLANIRMPIP